MDGTVSWGNTQELQSLVNICKVKIKSRINKVSENHESADVRTFLLCRRAAGCQRVTIILMKSFIPNLPASLTIICQARAGPVVYRKPQLVSISPLVSFIFLICK